MKSETCSRCGEEVRYGVRGTTTGWLHREDGDHVAVLGYIATAEDKAHWEAERLVERQRMPTAAASHCETFQALTPLETYTVAEEDIRRDKDVERRKARLAELRGEDPDYVAPIPEPEVAQHDLSIESFPPRSGIRQILNLLTKTKGWEIINITGSRGPYMGSGGEVLSISDATVVRAQGPTLDSGRALAVASWRDGAFDFAYTGILKDGVVTSTAANSTALKAWIKETSP